jgi:hypothetical protein
MMTLVCILALLLAVVVVWDAGKPKSGPGRERSEAEDEKDYADHSGEEIKR